MPRVKLTNNFYLDEFTQTDHREFLAENEAEGAEYEGVLRRLCLEIMQKIRDEWGPVKIKSGFRGSKLNAAVGSTPRSQHRKGEACDFDIVGFGTPAGRMAFATWAMDQYDCNDLRFHQLLVEPGCIHISLATGTRDGEVGKWEKTKDAQGKWTRKKEVIRRGE